MNKEKMQIVIDNLKKLSKSKFNFYRVVAKFDSVNNCGSVCCVVGWFPKWFPSEVKWLDHSLGYTGLHLVEVGKYQEFQTVASKVLDMSEEICCNLFSPLCQKEVHKDLESIAEDETPLQVAEMLEHFVRLVDEGEIDAWC